ncbi:MAG: hypothetical protein JWP46_3847 [Modestobacter sp.]|nr:hypothetical protein [Modestobacter sp.]
MLPPRLRAHRSLQLAVLALGLLSAASNCAFLVRAVSGSRLDPLNSFISELEVPGQPDSGFFRWASLVSALLAVVFAAGLLLGLPWGRCGVAGCAALALFGVAGVIDAVIPMDCAPSASVMCMRAQEQGPTSWAYEAHTWFDVLGTVALLASLWLLGRHLRPHPGWRAVAVVGSTGFVWLTAGSGVLTVMSLWYAPGVGVAQRLQVLAISAWLVVLAIAQARRPAARTVDAASASSAGPWRSGESVGPNGCTAPEAHRGACPG